MMSPAMADTFKEMDMCLSIMQKSINTIEKALKEGKLPKEVDPEVVEAWKKKTLQVISAK